jgi:adenylosuccinate synthase
VNPIRVVLGLGFGDEGKGTIVDWLASQAATPPLVVRWNGGPQAAHHVVTDDGRVHCFAQLGAGSFVAGARTHLCGDMAVDLYALWTEAEAFAQLAGGTAADSVGRVTVDPRCALVTPWHAAVNLVREALRGQGRHGSTGRGVGEAKLGAVRLFAGELGDGYDTAARIRDARMALLARATAAIEAAAAHVAVDDRLRAREVVAAAAEPTVLAAFLDAAARPLAVAEHAPPADDIIFESAQGALLDREHGFFPHVTPSRITRRAAHDVARSLGFTAPLEVWGVLRAYQTRHGEGPLPSEDAALAARLPEHHNREDGPAGRFRVGWFDTVLARYAVAVAGPIDRLAVTCLDRIAELPDRAVVDAWRGVSADARPTEVEAAVGTAVPVVHPVDDVAATIEAVVGRPLDVASFGPRRGDKRTSRR